MKVLLVKDVYKLGHAGEVKKVADGYGRNYLIPQGLAVLATPGALKQAERIRKAAAERRARLNQEMSGVAEQIQGLQLAFPARAGETGKLYGSITTRMIAAAIEEQTGVEVSPRQIDSQPLRTLGEHVVDVRLTMDLVPQVRVLVYREGEALTAAEEEGMAEEGLEEAAPVETPEAEAAEAVEAGAEAEVGEPAVASAAAGEMESIVAEGGEPDETLAEQVPEEVDEAGEEGGEAVAEEAPEEA